MKVHIATKSFLKVNAVKKAFKEVFGKRKFIYIPHDVKSEVNEQPEGEGIIIGLRNRARNVRNEINDKPYIIVSIESGILRRKNGEYIEIARVQVSEKGINTFATSDSVSVPSKYINEARRRGFKKYTYAMIMSEEMGSDPKDPLFYLSGVKREVYIKDALVKALKKHIKKSKLLKF